MLAKNFPKLFKRSSTGKIQEWSIIAHSENGVAGYTVTHGQVGGKLQTTSTEIRQGKNIGKANATNVFEQACSESQSKWNKQLDKGYTEKPEGKSLATKPMLAHDYQKYKHQVTFPCFFQPKLDGIRCIAIRHPKRVELLSRMGKPIETMDHIVKQLEHAMEPGEIWDGELYIHGVPFQQITSWVKRRQENSLLVQYHVYDCIDTGDFKQRYGDVDNILHVEDHSHIKTVSWAVVNSHEEVKAKHDEYVLAGYEGAMLRHNGCVYKAGYRSRDLLKVKEFIDDEFKIVGANEGVGKFKGMATFTCVTKDGTKFECTPKGDEAQRSEYWTNRKKYIGKKLTVRFFGWTDSTPPVPRFPVGIAIRDYE
jgi:DNA ligase-1